MTIKEAIASLTRMVESGGFREDDDLAITWWSYEDVQLVVDEEMDNDKARAIWAEVYEEVAHWDDLDHQQVQQEIYSVIEKQEKEEEE